MSAALRDWWALRTEREQRLLLVMAALAMLVFVWLAVVRPLGSSIEAARERHGEAVIALADAQAAAAARGTAQAPTRPELPVAPFLTRNAGEAGFPDARIAAEGPARAAVSIAAARPQAAFAWIAVLETQGLRVETLRAQANSDRTVALELRLAAEGG